MAMIPELGVAVEVRRCSDGSALPVLTTPAGKMFVISEEGLEFDVHMKTSSLFPVPRRTDVVYGASLKIDSADVGYWKTTIRPDQKYTFEGFCTGANESGASTYRRFKFAKADAGRDNGPQVADPEQIKAGRITLTITMEQALGTRQRPILPSAGPSAAGLGHLPEGKKFFLGPSLKTAEGSADFRQVTWSNVEYRTIETVGQLELRYETASTLLLRKTLDKANPAHRQLLAGSRDPTVLALLGESDSEGEEEEEDASRRQQRERPPAPPGGAGGAGADTRVKRERGEGGGGAAGPAAARVKHEPGGGGRGGGGGGGGVVDLTKPANAPLVVGGRVVARDEVAVCDLLDSDDDTAAAGGGARWEVRKRQAVDV